jgi:hypothetical protein
MQMPADLPIQKMYLLTCFEQSLRLHWNSPLPEGHVAHEEQ